MSRKARKNVGVIGLGIIGTRVAAGLRAAGYQVYVWNRSAKPAPNFLGSPAEVAASAEIIQVFVSDAGALFEIIEALGDALTPQHVIVCNATVGPEAVLEAAQMVETRGAQFLDAPFTGSKMAAEKRQLVYYIGGSDSTFLKVKPVLEVTSKAIVRMGEIGHASTIKVVTNMISAVTVQALAEALSIVQKAGLEPEVLAAAIELNACRSGVIDLKLPKMMAGDYEPHFSLKHMFKDVQLGIHMANALDIEIPTTTVTAGVMYGAINQGWGDLDFASLYKNYAPVVNEDELPALPDISDGNDEAVEEAVAQLESGKSEVPGDVNSSGGEEVAPNDTRPDSAESAASEDLAPVIFGENGVSEKDGTTDAAAGRHIDVEVTRTEEPGPSPETKIDSEDKTNSPESGPDSFLGGEVKSTESVNGPDAAVSSEVPADPAKAPESAAEQKPEDAQSGEGSETTGRPSNFVRRWFVARTGG